VWPRNPEAPRKTGERTKARQSEHRQTESSRFRWKGYSTHVARFIKIQAQYLPNALVLWPESLVLPCRSVPLCFLDGTVLPDAPRGDSPSQTVSECPESSQAQGEIRRRRIRPKRSTCVVMASESRDGHRSTRRSNRTSPAVRWRPPCLWEAAYLFSCDTAFSA